MSAHLRLDGVSKAYGGQTVVDTVSLEVQPGEMVVLLGPSGCGKTTILRMIAGFAQPSGGDILLEQRSIRDTPAHLRGMGIVFQSYALFPHMSVAKNISFGLEMRGQSAREVSARVEEMLRLVKLEALAQRLPRQLSGGQQQRVALARALAIHPKVLLLDEPLSNLDAALRQEVARDIRILQREGGLTAIMVTHDQDEAMAMADRLVVLRDGRVQQIGSQEDLYERPQTPFVARFIGHSNMVTGTLRDDTLVLDDGIKLRLALRYGGTGAATLALRPERITVAPPRDDARVHGRIELSTYLGPVVEHVVTLGTATRVVVRNASSGGAARLYSPGETVDLDWDESGERLFDASEAPLPPIDERRKNSGRKVTSHA